MYTRAIFIAWIGFILSGCTTEEGERQRIQNISDIRIEPVATSPGALKVIVTGNTSSAGWTKAELVQYTYVQAPPDGMYDFDFFAVAPKGPSAAVITPIQTEFVFSQVPAGFQGVRVHAQMNNREAKYQPSQTTLGLTDIAEVSQVELVVMESYPEQLSITATGWAASSGWTEPTLVPDEAPSDGLYSFRFQAAPPDEVTTPVLTKIQARYVLAPMPNDLKGVKIISKSNQIIKLISMNKQAIMQVTGAKLSVSDDMLTINASGFVSSGGWGAPELVAFNYLLPPQDGIYDFTFMASPPTGIVIQVVSPIEVRHTVPLADIKGVRIHAQQGEPILVKLP